jgi:ABC-type molybdate transport system ATPase subunit
MPFPFKPYRLTRSTWEVLARLRLKLVLSKRPLLFFWPKDRISIERAKLSSPNVLLVLPLSSLPFESIDCSLALCDTLAR